MRFCSHLVKQSILPEPEHHHVSPVPGSERGKKVLRKGTERQAGCYFSGTWTHKDRDARDMAHLHWSFEMIPYLLIVSAKLDSIRDESGCLLFRHGADVLQPHCQLETGTVGSEE